MFEVTESKLRRLYEREPKRVAFVDEAYRERGEKPFYIVSAVVVHYEYLESVRDDILAIVETDYWHTTEAFKRDADPRLRGCLERIVARLAEDDAVTLCTIDAEAAHFAKLEAVRAMALVSMAELLAKHHEVDLMVYERRRAGEEESRDQKTESNVKAREGLRELRMHGGSPSSEPMLWAADVVASTLRRRIATDQREWFEPLRAKTTVHRSGNFERIDLD